MTTLSINKADALKAWRQADQNERRLLSNLFGEQLKLSENITERVKTFEDVCAEAGVDPKDYEIFGDATPEEEYLNNFRKLLLIVGVLNEGWKPDYTNTSEYKYYPWFQYTAGSGFSLNDVEPTDTGSHVGARLSYRTRDLAKFAATQFQDIYNQFLTFKQ